MERIFTDVARVRVHTISGTFTSETRNGTRTTRRDATTLENTETNFRTDYVFRNGGTATHVKTWTRPVHGGRGGRDPAGAAVALGHVEHRRHVVVDAGCERRIVDGDDEPGAALQRELHVAPGSIPAR